MELDTQCHLDGQLGMESVWLFDQSLGEIPLRGSTRSFVDKSNEYDLIEIARGGDRERERERGCDYFEEGKMKKRGRKVTQVVWKVA